MRWIWPVAGPAGTDGSRCTGASGISTGSAARRTGATVCGAGALVYTGAGAGAITVSIAGMGGAGCADGVDTDRWTGLETGGAEVSGGGPASTVEGSEALTTTRSRGCSAGAVEDALEGAALRESIVGTGLSRGICGAGPDGWAVSLRPRLGAAALAAVVVVAGSSATVGAESATEGLAGALASTNRRMGKPAAAIPGAGESLGASGRRSIGAAGSVSGAAVGELEAVPATETGAEGRLTRSATVPVASSLDGLLASTRRAGALAAAWPAADASDAAGAAPVLAVGSPRRWTGEAATEAEEAPVLDAAAAAVVAACAGAPESTSAGVALVDAVKAAEASLAAGTAVDGGDSSAGPPGVAEASVGRPCVGGGSATSRWTVGAGTDAVPVVGVPVRGGADVSSTISSLAAEGGSATTRCAETGSGAAVMLSEVVAAGSSCAGLDCGASGCSGVIEGVLSGVPGRFNAAPAAARWTARPSLAGAAVSVTGVLPRAAGTDAAGVEVSWSGARWTEPAGAGPPREVAGGWKLVAGGAAASALCSAWAT